MPFINSEFGSYDNYLAYFGKSSERDFIVKLTNNDLSTSEVLKINPSGITKLGKRYEKHNVYHSFFTSITLDLIFTMQPFGGGGFLNTAFNNLGIKADVSSQVYRRNPDTNDFDIIYNGKIDFTGESFNYLPNDNYVKCVMNESGYMKKFLSRHELELDVTKNISVDNIEITEVTKKNIQFTPIDIFLSSEARPGFINYTDSYSGLADVGLHYYNFDNGDVRYNYAGDRINFLDPTAGKIYTNTSDESKDLKFQCNIGYAYTVNLGLGDLVTIYIEVVTYNSADTIINTQTLLTAAITDTGLNEDSGYIIYEGSYISVPVDGYIVLRSKVHVIDAETGSTIIYNTSGEFQGRFWKLTERSNSIPATNCVCYPIIDLLSKLIRLITGSDTAFTFTPSEFTTVINDVVTNGYLIREFYDKGMVISFKDAFRALDAVYPVTLQYDEVNDQFVLRPRSYSFINAQSINIGKVDKLTIMPGKYFNKILAGSAGDGKYEQDQGIFEFNVKHEYITPFEVSGTLDIRSPLNMDSIAIELTRRFQHHITGLKDTDFDKTNFYVRTNGTQTVVNGSSYTGFEGIEQYYNGEINAKKSLLRHSPYFAGMFYKEQNTSAIKFANNAKDIDISYPGGTLQEDITKADFGSGVTDAITYEIETFLTDDLVAGFEANKHRYIAFMDDNEVNYYGFCDVFDAGIDSKDTKLILTKVHL